MSTFAGYETKTETLLKPIASAHKVEIYDIEYIKEGSDFILRIFIDKEGGVNINDCEAVSRTLSEALDESDFIPDAYILEVSSPGLGRSLRKDKHLAKSIGAEVEIKTYKPFIPENQNTELINEPDKKLKKKGNKPPGSKKEFSGTLKGFDKDKIIIDDNGFEISFKRSEIAVIRLKFDF